MFDTLRADLTAQLDFDATPTFSRLLRVFLFHPGYGVVCRYRLMRFCSSNRLLKPFSKIFWYMNIFMNGCYISPHASMGKGLALPHPVGIVVGDGTTVGDHVTIYQHVTLGRGNFRDRRYPHIEHGVTLYAGCCIIGGITIGADFVVGANAVVNRDVPAKHMAVGIPATSRRMS